jgi:hypothetical protein
MKSLIWTALIPFVLGLPMLIFGMKDLYQVNKFVNRGAHAEGIIVEMKKGSSILSKYHPRVRFQTKEGKTIEFSPGNGSNPPIYEVNDHVPVVYNRDYPNHAVINSFIEIWLGPVIYAGLGLLLLIFSSFQWVKSRSQSK